MFNLFSKKEESAAETSEAKNDYPTAPGTEIRFDPELIGSLQSDHQKLLGLYGDINQAVEGGDFATAADLLNTFRGALQGHLLTENVRLYIYLERSFAHDDTNSDLIRDFRREMDGIGKVVMNFLRKYEAIGVNSDLAEAFKRDFAELGKVLVERIQREESTLYPLYLPTYR